MGSVIPMVLHYTTETWLVSDPKRLMDGYNFLVQNSLEVRINTCTNVCFVKSWVHPLKTKLQYGTFLIKVLSCTLFCDALVVTPDNTRLCIRSLSKCRAFVKGLGNLEIIR